MDYVRRSSAAVLTVLLLAIFLARNVGIYFETNDDVSMMMLAHGFGITNHPTSQILFSNRLEADLIEFIGMPFGQPGYAIYMLACLALSVGCIFSSLARMNRNALLSGAVIAALAVRPLLAPQFTIIASFLTIAGVVAFLDYRATNALWLLVSAVVLVFLGFLMRMEAAGFVLLIASPMLLRTQSFRRSTLVAGVLFLAAAGAAFWWDRLGYMSPGWAAFNAVEGPRTLFTDFGLGYRLLEKPELLATVGWSSNDVFMISKWWFFDPQVYSAARLDRLLASVGQFGFGPEYLRILVSWPALLLNWDMAPIALLCALLVVTSAMQGQRWILVSVAICFAIFVVFALLGRPGVSRVTYSGVAVIAVLACLSPLPRAWARALALAALLCGIVSSFLYVSQAAASRSQQQVAIKEIAQLPSQDVIVVWGDALPFQSLYPAFLRSGEDYPKLGMYSLGSDQLAPHALSWWGGDPGGLIAKLRSSGGIGLIADDMLVDRLAVYCREHWGAQLQVSHSVNLGQWSYYQLGCPGRS